MPSNAELVVANPMLEADDGDGGDDDGSSGGHEMFASSVQAVVERGAEELWSAAKTTTELTEEILAAEKETLNALQNSDRFRRTKLLASIVTPAMDGHVAPDWHD